MSDYFILSQLSPYCYLVEQMKEPEKGNVSRYYCHTFRQAVDYLKKNSVAGDVIEGRDLSDREKAGLETLININKRKYEGGTQHG